MQYTTKGLVKKWAWQILWANLLVVSLLGAVQMRRENVSLAAGTGGLVVKCRQVLAQGLGFLSRAVS